MSKTKKNIFIKSNSDQDNNIKLNSTKLSVRSTVSTSASNSVDLVDSVDSDNLSDEFKNVVLGQKNKNNNVIKNIASDNSNNLTNDLDKLKKNDLDKLKKNDLDKVKKNDDNIVNKKEIDIMNKNNIDFDIASIFFDISNCLNKHSGIKIVGEIISFKISDTNAWVTIKSKEFQISSIFWKITKDKDFQTLKLTKSGDQVVFNGNFSIMKKNLSVYFNIKSMEKIGKGNYLDIYEQYRLKIKEYGLGIPKKKLLTYPYVIGIITAQGGAAIQDILQTFRLDKFVGKIIIKNSIVQGNQCPKSLINSIEWFEINHPNSIDILIVTRGGGGWEDLVGFSDWELLEKISLTPFITLSAVGHQIDNQLTDEVCDYKFATPSIGAKFIVETQQKYRPNLTVIKNLLTNLLNTYNKNILKYKFITENYQNIIMRYDIKNMLVTVRKYKNILGGISYRFGKSKSNFYSRLSELKPTIIRKKELTSINDFVSKDNGKEVSPKKIEIYFIDGKITISYKITDHQHY